MTTPVRSLADRVWDYRLGKEWYYRLRRGLPVEHLRIEGDASREKDARFAAGILAELRGVAAADEDDRLTSGFLEYVLGGWVDRARHPLLGFSVTPYSSPVQGTTLQLVFKPFQGKPPTYLSLVQDLRSQVREMGARLARQREAGILVPKAALPGVRESLTLTRAAVATVLQGAAPSAVRERVQKLLDDEVLPAFDELLAAVGEEYESAAPVELGIGQYDGGDEAYRMLVRHYTSSELTPEQVHQLGLDQVADLSERMAKARADMGFSGTEEEFHAQLAVNPRVHASSPDEVEALFLRHMAALEPLISRWFSVLPKAPYGVARLEPEAEVGQTYGYYEPPTSVQPVGRYRWNGAHLEHKSLLTYPTVIFHELAPGHHFHIARQSENEALPDLRREGLDIGAFNEGWAEYAAGLGWEMGLYDDALDGYGRLVHERFIAQRLVVDTGLNLKGWSRDQAAAYMKANTTESDGQVASEILRYSVDDPGQALAYRIGFVQLNRIRAKTEQAMGSAFDIRDFHEHLLGPGALPLQVVEGHINRWVAGQVRGPGISKLDQLEGGQPR